LEERVSGRERNQDKDTNRSKEGEYPSTKRGREMGNAEHTKKRLIWKR
jgi:hypothetical protein